MLGSEQSLEGTFVVAPPVYPTARLYMQLSFFERNMDGVACQSHAVMIYDVIYRKGKFSIIV